MKDKHLPVFFTIENTMNPDQIYNSIYNNGAPNIQGTFSMLHCCLQTRNVPLPKPLVNKLPSATVKYFNFWLIIHSTAKSAAIFIILVSIYFLSYLSHLTLFPHWRFVFLAAALQWRVLLARLQTVNGCSWVSLVSASSELMALFSFFWFQRVISLMCLYTARFFVFLQKRLSSTSWNPSLLWNLCLGQTFADAVELRYVSLLGSILSRHETVFLYVTLLTEFDYSSHSFKPSKQFSGSFYDWVSIYVQHWWTSAPV